MTERTASSANPAQNENSFLGGQSKEAIIISNNLMTMNRAFGRDISNIHDNDTIPMNSIIDKYESQLMANDLMLDNEMKTNDTNGVAGDLSMADFPKAFEDPLLASREILCTKSAGEKNKEVTKAEKSTQETSKSVTKSIYNGKL